MPLVFLLGSQSKLTYVVIALRNSKLPQELVDHIVDKIEDWDALSSATLISRIWTTRAQKRQYKKSVINGQPSFDTLEEIFQCSPHLSTEVEVLSIHAKALVDPIHTITSVCGGMANLRSLSLHETDIERRIDVPLFCGFIGSLPHLSSLSFHKCVLLGDSAALIVEAATALESLSFIECDPHHGHRSILRSTPPIPDRPLDFRCRIRTLNVDDYSRKRLDIFLPYPIVLSSITRLTYDSRSRRTLSAILQCAKESLEELTVITRSECEEGSGTCLSHPK